MAYDTTARRGQLKLSQIPGTSAQVQQCKALGWALVELYFDFEAGEDVVYNEGCSEEDLWSTGLGFDEYDEDKDEWITLCEKLPRNPDMSYNWDSW